jgi:TRAP transporter TAXI family solute receptor
MNVMRVATVGSAIALACLVGCTGKAESEASAAVTLKISATTADAFATAIPSVPGIKFQVATEGGSSITSLNDLRHGTIDLSMPMADVAYLAYSGQLREMGGAFDQLRGLAVLNLNAVHLIAGTHTRVRDIGDLKGLRISLGPPGSAIVLIAEQLLGVYGLSIKDVRGQQVPNPELAETLMSGRIDAAFVIFNPPDERVARVLRAGGRLIEITGPAIEDLRTRYPYLKRTVMPRGTYPNQDAPVHTLGIDALMVSRADVDEEVIYRLLDAYFGTRAATGPTDLERAPATPIPLHPGAARFYRQRELSK